MLDTGQWFGAPLLGIALAIPWGIAAWLKWQQMKSLTIIPAGAIPAAYGKALGYTINVICIGILYSFYDSLQWLIVLSLGIVLFAGGWVATIIERRLYCTKTHLDAIVYVVRDFAKMASVDDTVKYFSMVAPKWWIKLMPLDWQRELRRQLEPILVPETVEDKNRIG